MCEKSSYNVEFRRICGKYATLSAAYIPHLRSHMRIFRKLQLKTARTCEQIRTCEKNREFENKMSTMFINRFGFRILASHPYWDGA